MATAVSTLATGNMGKKGVSSAGNTASTVVKKYNAKLASGGKMYKGQKYNKYWFVCDDQSGAGNTDIFGTVFIMKTEYDDTKCLPTSLTVTYTDA